ncbi:hypothetical protein GUITHDRAFT_157624 [Guillardia theta CCMP2712]|uniref:Acetyl-coenzyme A synthetase n=1 Tax=Guillardia theta (strain CCMP2712) TaxID=905079 RepID=L1JGA4_GUITC|nr:hypothetical protein GUITHDRAFT_157624 [Guillardia theta CCMP2712]EKX47337.1 hypothetical protein GUITHDRAFT_157624 [Guillardia theta CCMP2712]|eukprot:XP_005834317.1 hypothetical protein GUITHDRAFT_157624 [Guillardia theta CCMP2712]
MAGAYVSNMAQYNKMYRQSLDEPEKFWGMMSKDFYWKEMWHTLNEVNFDYTKGPVSIKWFLGSKTNLAYNALDRHIEAGKGDNIAFYWEGNDDESRAYTYNEVYEMVCKFANVLKSKGIKKGDTVAIYLPMVVELPVAMLACARIGAVHSVVFGGFSADALASRVADCKARVLVTADGVMRAKKLVNLLDIVDNADKILKADKEANHKLDSIIVVERNSKAGPLKEQHEPWNKLMAGASADCPVEWMDAEDPLFLLYTSGSTGKPKGVLHTTAGYMVWSATTFKYVFDYRPGDVYWCTADCGWITGHSYITYGPMINGATQVLFEGVPTHPTPARCWEIIDKYKVNQFYTAPTAVRSLMSFGEQYPEGHSLKSLRVLGSVGEPINPEAWRWYSKHVGRGQCSISDTWWQTETGGHMITPLPGATPQKPGFATKPFFGVEPAILDPDGKEQDGACAGYLTIKRSWPGQLRGIYGDQERFEKTYFQLFNGANEMISKDKYITGDACRRDKDGYYCITGRIDDVINVSGHRIGTAELESALSQFEHCVEAAVVGFPHPIKGEAIYAFVTLEQGYEMTPEVQKALKQVVRSEIGAFAAPDKIQFAPALPKTRSGKIMRRILRRIAAGVTDVSEFGDISTITDPSIIDELLENAKHAS